MTARLRWVPTRTLPRARAAAWSGWARSYTPPVTASAPPVRAWSERPATPRASEVRFTVRVAAREPAVAVEGVTTRFALSPAASRAGLATARRAVELVARTPRLSW